MPSQPTETIDIMIGSKDGDEVSQAEKLTESLKDAMQGKIVDFKSQELEQACKTHMQEDGAGPGCDRKL